MSSRITLLNIILSCEKDLYTLATCEQCPPPAPVKTYPPGLTEEAVSVTADPWPLAHGRAGEIMESLSGVGACSGDDTSAIVMSTIYNGGNKTITNHPSNIGSCPTSDREATSGDIELEFEFV